MVEIFFYGSLLIGIALTVFWVRHELPDHYGMPWLAGVFGTFLTALLVGVTMVIIAICTTDSHETDTYTLKSLTTSSEFAGQFGGNIFVSYGYIESAPYYTFYVEAGPNEYTLVSVPAEGSRVIESDSKPSVKCDIRLFDTPQPFGGPVEDWTENPYALVDAYACTLTIPPGSVANDIDPNYKG